MKPLRPLDNPVPMAWRGGWSEEASYVPGEVVHFDGAVFVAQTESLGSKPDQWCEEDCIWVPLASRSR